MRDLSIVTFATFGNNLGFRDYTNQFEAMKMTCNREGVALSCYTFKECAFPDSEIVNREFPMRRGAGYWAWKPELIIHAISKSETRFVLYIDVDLKIQNLNSILVDENFNQSGLALFKTREVLAEWSSQRCLKLFKLSRNNSDLIYSASAILVDSSNAQAISSLRVWQESLRDSRKILDPVFSLKRNHRHDQSILSCLIATSEISVSDLLGGFYQTGVDNGILEPESAWLVHGDIESEKNIEIKHRLIGYRSFIFHKYQITQYLTATYYSRLKNKVITLLNNWTYRQ